MKQWEMTWRVLIHERDEPEELQWRILIHERDEPEELQWIINALEQFSIECPK